MRLIDADALYVWVKTECNPYGKPSLDFESGKKVLDMIDRMPTIKPEQRKGHWLFEEYPDGYYKSECSECEWRFSEEAYLENWNFCPNCGADMRGEKKWLI